MPLNCHYCKQPAELVDGSQIYPRRPDLSHKLFWRCQPCGAHVGCHPGTSNALGRLANAELRQARINAHAHFDQIWRTKQMSRSRAYQWMAKKLGIDQEQMHMGSFDVAQCKRVIEVCLARKPKAVSK